MSLTLMQEIENFKKETFPKISKDVLEQFIKTTDELVASGIDKQALKVGDRIPSFELPDYHGRTVSSDELLKEGPLVVSFYRGGWCPYCSLELRALQKSYPQIKENNANLTAISPQLPNYSAQTAEKNNLEFYLLSDQDNRVAKKFGLVFELIKELASLFKVAFDLDLKKVNGSDKYELPIPATYVVGQDGLIKFNFVDADYTKRLEPARIIEVLKELKS